jgi:hypothetical protein
MKLTRIFIVILLSFLYSLSLQAQVYEWTDEKGVKHYSNVEPSESVEEIKKKQENKENRPQGKTGSSVKKGKTFKKKGSTPKKAAPESEKGSTPVSEQNSEEDFSANLNLKLEQFPITQDDLINEEKARVQKIKNYSEKNSIKPEDIIQKEKNRLLKAITDLQGAPLVKFGSQDNKRRQIGYYKYRLEELLKSGRLFPRRWLIRFLITSISSGATRQCHK